MSDRVLPQTPKKEPMSHLLLMRETRPDLNCSLPQDHYKSEFVIEPNQRLVANLLSTAYQKHYTAQDDPLVKCTFGLRNPYDDLIATVSLKRFVYPEAAGLRLHNVAVHPSYQRGGRGTLLVNVAQLITGPNPLYTLINTKVTPDAEAFYRHLGFTEVSV